MKLPVLISGFIVSLALVSCSEQAPAESTTDYTISPTPLGTSIAYEDMPPITETNVTVDCKSYSPDALAFIRQQTDVTVNGVQYRVATIGCGEMNSELGSEFVESFVAENGVWASNGLVSGPDVPFNTSGPCESDNSVARCPAYYVSEGGESPDYSYVEYSGYVEITGQDNGLVWTFVVEEEVAL
jgi:hypothetical protein